MISARFTRNFPAISPEEFDILQNSHVFVAGCGGLGGHLINHLLRTGIGHLTAIDGDVLEESNLNRQLLAFSDTLGIPKAEAALTYARRLYPEADFTARQIFLTPENAEELLTGQDLAVDALDNIESRFALAKACDRLLIPLVYGAIRGWSLQVSVFPPGCAEERLSLLYPSSAKLTDKSCLSFTPAACASIQSAEAVKSLLHKESCCQSSLLFADLLQNEWEYLPFA